MESMLLWSESLINKNASIAPGIATRKQEAAISSKVHR